MKRVLCVDDDPDDREDMTRNLLQKGYDVEVAATPREALISVSASPFGYEAVLTDLDFGGASPHNGVWLVQQLLSLRESRGYDPAPEIISVTGKMIDPDVLNRLEALGSHYVLKGRAESYLVEIDAAMDRLDRFRRQGPALVFVHTCSMEQMASSDNAVPQFGCAVGEAVNSAYLLHSGVRFKVPIAPAPLLLFDYLGRRAVRRPLRLEEIANGMNSEEFYYFWLGREQDHTVSSDSVKMNIKRIRKALATALHSASLAIDPDGVLATERIVDESGEDDSEGTAYRLKACIAVEHSS